MALGHAAVIGQTDPVTTRRPRPYPLGVHPVAGGVDVAVLAEHADRIQLCLFTPDGAGWAEERVDLPDREHGVWFGHVPGVAVGTRYGLRAHGDWDPARGRLHNPAKLLLDPYARAVGFPPGRVPGRLDVVPELFGHPVDAALQGPVTGPDPRDSAPFAPLGVVTGAPGAWPDETADPDRNRPGTSWADTVVYEAHVKGLTRRLPGVPQALRGTYAGLGHPATLEHLRRLGATAVELLPVHAIADEPHLAARGAVNYWGYSTLAFNAPHPGYAAASDPLAQLDEFRQMVFRLHEAGLEVLLDVVYNHTAEGGAGGPMLSWRGLDAATYYRLDPHGGFVDVTGCGNSLDFSQARVVQLTLDSLRYWVQVMGVDGFRFDLATTLARGRDGYEADHPLLVAIRTDPVLAGVKLIAEPWDVGPYGWRTGAFPPPFAEWNDHFRDGVREFWLQGAARAARGESPGGVRDLATRLAGSADVFPAGRGPLASLNFVTAHDGFTLADLTAYSRKHNEPNGEGGRDGSDNNRSWPHGPEGPTEDPEVLAARRRTLRNLLGTLLLATGVPMLVAGDEFGRSQGGNNNAYCLDDESTWLDWNLQPWQQRLLTTTTHLLRLRREHPVLHQNAFFAGRPVHHDGTKDLAWFAADGREMDHERWHDAGQRVLQMYLHAVDRGPQGRHLDPSLLVVVQGSAAPEQVRLPERRWGRSFELVWDSAFEEPPDHPHGPQTTVLEPGTVLAVAANTVQVYRIPPP